MKHAEPIFKWICLILIVWIVSHGLYHWRDTRYEQAVQRANSLAVPLAQLNNLIGKDQAELISQVNTVLTNNGYAQLARKIEVDNNKKAVNEE